MTTQPGKFQADWMPHPNVPRTVALELLWGCNLKCNYCYIGAERNWRNPIVPRPKVLFSLIDKIASAHVQEIYLLGGEPTAHPKFEAICEHIAQAAIPIRGICTNGTLMTHDVAQMLKAFDFYVDISFRGASEDIFDQITGIQGSFEKAVKGALTLSEVGLPVGIEFDCTAQAASGLYALIRTLVERGVRIHHLFLHRISPLGDASQLPDKGRMTLEQYKCVFEQARQITADFAILTTFEDGFPLCLIEQADWEHVVPCECGTFLATVDPGGNVRRCACHPLMLGNLLETDLKTIWSDSLQEFRSLSWLNDACKSCTLLPQCRGGCAVSSSDCAKGFAPDIFQEQFVPSQLEPPVVATKGIVGQKVITTL
jgi:radical SAM protein with 4Fe4S-binding SPASM domain